MFCRIRLRELPSRFARGLFRAVDEYLRQRSQLLSGRSV